MSNITPSKELLIALSNAIGIALCAESHATSHAACNGATRGTSHAVCDAATRTAFNTILNAIPSSKLQNICVLSPVQNDSFFDNYPLVYEKPTDTMTVTELFYCKAPSDDIILLRKLMLKKVETGELIEGRKFNENQIKTSTGKLVNVKPVDDFETKPVNVRKTAKGSCVMLLECIKCKKYYSIYFSM